MKLQSIEDMFGIINVNTDICHYVQALGAGTVKVPNKSHENPDVDSDTSVSGVLWKHIHTTYMCPFSLIITQLLRYPHFLSTCILPEPQNML